MGWEIRALGVLAAFTIACGGHNEVHSVEQPTMETVDRSRPGEDTSASRASEDGLGAQVVAGFLRPCERVSASGGLVELSCGEHQIVEFRKAESAGPDNADADLDELIAILRARFGELRERRGDNKIDALGVRMSRFAVEEGANGMAVVIANQEGNYWALACYRKQGAASEDFCGDAIATAARAGGLAHVEAKNNSFAKGKLQTGEGCTSNPRGISCITGKLSWSALGVNAASLRDETSSKLERQARAEKVSFRSEDKKCSLLGKAAQCRWLHLQNKAKGEELSFILVVGAEEERLVVCTFPGPSSAILPEPCNQAIEF